MLDTAPLDPARSDPTSPDPADPARAARPLADAGDRAPLQQTALWAQACRSLGVDLCPLPAPHPGFAILRHLPLLGPVAMISRPVAAFDATQAAALRQALGARHLLVHAETPEQARALAAARFRRIARPRLIADLPLASDPGAMAATLSVKWRNRLRHGLRAGLQVTRRPMPADPHHWLLRAERAEARRLGYRPLPPVIIAALAGARPGAAQLFTAHLAGQRVAAMLFLRHGRAATYQIGWTTPEGRAVSGGNVLMWRAMLDLQAMGVDRIDLGAADPTEARGLARFKRGTGAVLRPLGGSWLSSALLGGPGPWRMRDVA